MTLKRCAWFFCLWAVGCTEASPEAQSADAKEGALGTLRFEADWSEALDGILLEGKAVKVAYDPARLETCEGYQGGRPVWSITGWVQYDDGKPKSFPVLDPNHPEGYQHILELSGAGAMQLWFESTNIWGCHAYDSDEGRNYRFDVKEATSFPTWAGDERMVLSRCEEDGACVDETRPLAEDFVFDTVARQRATAHHLHFEAWEPGVSDWDNPDLALALEAQIHVRYEADAPFEAWPVDLAGREGNNAAWVVNLRHLDPFGGEHVELEEDCPKVPFYGTVDDRVAADVEYYLTINGVELRPKGGTYRGRFEDYAALYDLCAAE